MFVSRSGSPRVPVAKCERRLDRDDSRTRAAVPASYSPFLARSIKNTALQYEPATTSSPRRVTGRPRAELTQVELELLKETWKMMMIKRKATVIIVG